jgi:hypothetical protein
LVKLREVLETSSNPWVGFDGKTVHWLVKRSNEGLQFVDSAGLLQHVGYSAINMMVRRESLQGKDMGEVNLNEYTALLFQRFLDWLALNLPQSKTWGVEFVQGCPPIACDREVVRSDA